MISRIKFLASTLSLYFSNVCCHSSAECISTTVTIDRTPPRLGRLLVLQHDEDAELDDPKTSSYQYSKIVMRLALRNFTDPESGILASTAAVYRTDGWLIQPETSLGARDFVTFAVPFEDGRSYYASVTVYNRVELTAVINSSVVTVDATPPVIAYVRDAIGSGFPHLRGANGEDAEAVALNALEVGCLFHAYDLQSGLRGEWVADCGRGHSDSGCHSTRTAERANHPYGCEELCGSGVKLLPTLIMARVGRGGDRDGKVYPLLRD